MSLLVGLPWISVNFIYAWGYTIPCVFTLPIKTYYKWNIHSRWTECVEETKFYYFAIVIIYKMNFLFRMNETDICRTVAFMKSIMFFSSTNHKSIKYKDFDREVLTMYLQQTLKLSFSCGLNLYDFSCTLNKWIMC